MNLGRLTTCLLTLGALGASNAHAAGEPPSDDALLGARAVGVLPVLTTGSRAAAYARLSAYVARGEGKTSILSARALAHVDGDAGFGFAGASTDADVNVMRYAFLLGGIAASSGDPAAIREEAQTLTQAREALAPLAPPLVAAIDAALAAAREGRVDARALAQVMAEAEAAIAKGPARAHGYFSAGMWLGLSMVAVTLPEADPAFVAMAPPLATMLEEDAAFDGSDRGLARELRQVARLLAVGHVDVGAYKAALTRAFSIDADQP